MSTSLSLVAIPSLLEVEGSSTSGTTGAKGAGERVASASCGESSRRGRGGSKAPDSRRRREGP